LRRLRLGKGRVIEEEKRKVERRGRRRLSKEEIARFFGEEVEKT